MFVAIDTREGSCCDIDYQFLGLFHIREGVDYREIIKEFYDLFPKEITYPSFSRMESNSKEYDEYSMLCHNLRIERKDKIDKVLEYYKNKYNTNNFFEIIVKFLEEHDIKKIDCLCDCVSEPKQDYC